MVIHARAVGQPSQRDKTSEKRIKLDCRKRWNSLIKRTKCMAQWMWLDRRAFSFVSHQLVCHFYRYCVASRGRVDKDAVQTVLMKNRTKLHNGRVDFFFFSPLQINLDIRCAVFFIRKYRHTKIHNSHVSIKTSHFCLIWNKNAQQKQPLIHLTTSTNGCLPFVRSSFVYRVLAIRLHWDAAFLSWHNISV